jgi:antitoxin component YwqK of YwqJK toxin-antitoxin module
MIMSKPVVLQSSVPVLVVLVALSQAAPATAQSAARQPQLAAIYLDEPEVVAEPSLVGHETVREQYEDGRVRLEREVAKFSDNHFEADGVYREFYPNGNKFVEGQYRRGRQEGEWTFWFDNGQLNRKATYSNGQPDGSWEVFRADGTLAAKRSFKNGLRHGEWIAYDDTGKQPLREEHYVDNKMDGVWKVWYPSGKLKQQAGFKLGVQHGTTNQWNEDGEKVIELPYVDGKLHGTALQVLQDGRRIQQQYNAGKLVPQSKP